MIRQAKKYLEMLEEQSLQRGGQNDLFTGTKEQQAEPETDALREAFQAVNPDELSPREALELLYRLKKLD